VNSGEYTTISDMALQKFMQSIDRKVEGPGFVGNSLENLNNIDEIEIRNFEVKEEVEELKF
jgi:hypothetical protein